MAGELNITETLNNDEFLRNLEKSNQALSSHTANVQRESSKIDDALSNIGKVAAGYFGIQAMQSFVSQLVNVRGEFQQLDVAFSTMLRSKEKANELMAQIVDTAAKTPFTLTQVASGAKQLLAYQVAAEDVNDTVIRLGNISAGVSVPLDRLILAYGQVKAKGKLQGDDMRQFTEAGIPMIHELAKVMGVADNEISKMVESGKIGFPQVQQVVQNLTNSGGMFYNLMEKQSKTLTGELSNLHDAWDRMLNKMGESNDGALSGMILSATSLVENYQEVLDIIGGLVIVYGAYKAAVIAVNVVSAIQREIAVQQMLANIGNTGATITLTTAEGLQAVAASAASKAQLALNASMLANPYVLGAMALAGLVVGLIAYVKATDSAANSKKRIDEMNSSVNSKIDEQKSKTDTLVQSIQSETSTNLTKIEALQKLQELYPSIFANMDAEQVKKMNSVELQKKINQELENQKLIEKEKQAQSQIDIMQKHDSFVPEQMPNGATTVNPISSSDYDTAVKTTQQLREEIGKLKQAQWEANTPITEQLAYYSDIKKNLQEQQTELEKTRKKNVDITDSWGGFKSAVEQMSFNAILTQLNTIDGKIKGLSVLNPTAGQTVGQRTDENVNSTKEAEDRLRQMRAKGSTATIGEIKAQQDKIKELKSDYSTLTGVVEKHHSTVHKVVEGTLEYYHKLAKTLKESATSYDSITRKYTNKKGEDITPKISDSEQKIKELTFRSFDEEVTYKKSQYDEYYRYISLVGQEAADKQYSALLKGGASYTEYLQSQHEKLGKIIDSGTATTEQVANFNKITTALQAINGVKNPFERFTDDLTKLKEESKTTGEYLDALAKKKEDIQSGKTNLSTEDKTKAVNQIDKTIAETSKKNLDDLLNKYKSIQQQMLDVQDQYNSDIRILSASLVSAQTDEQRKAASDAIKLREDGYNQELTLLGDNVLKQTSLYHQLFGDLSNVGYDSLRGLNNKVKSMLDSATKSTDSTGSISYSVIVDTKDSEGNTIQKSVKITESVFNELKQKTKENGDQMSKSNPFKSLIDDIKDYSKATTDEEKKASVKKIAGDAASSIDLVKGTFDSVVNGMDKMGVAMDDNTKAIIGDIGGILEGASQLAQGIATGNPLAIVQGSISVISSGIDLIFGGKDRKIEKSIKEHQQAVKDLEVEYNELKKAVDKALGEDYLKDQASVINNLKLQKAELEQELALAESKSGKKKDQSQIDDIKSQLQTVSDSINDTIDAMSQKIMTTTGKDFASTLGSAIFDAVASGADAFDVIQEKSKDVVSNIVKQWLETKLLEKPLQEALDTLENKIVVKTNDGSVDKIAELQAKINELSKTNLSKSMFASQIKDYEDQIAKLQSSSTSSSWTELNLNTPEAQAALEEFKTNTQALGQDYASVLNQMNWLFDTSSSTNSTKGAIQGTSEETAGIIAGRLTNIILSNDRFATAQEEGLKVNRSMLITLNSIDTNTANTVSELKDMNNLLKTDSGLMRAKGLF